MATYKCQDCSHEVISAVRLTECNICGGRNIRVLGNDRLFLKRSVVVKAIVTHHWKEEVQEQLQKQLNQLDNQLQQLEMQGQPKQRELLEQKEQMLQQLHQVYLLEMEQEVNQGELESLFKISQGESLIQKMQVEIVLRDGVVEEIRFQP